MSRVYITKHGNVDKGYSIILYKYKNHFFQMKGDIGMGKTSGTRGCIPHPYIFVYTTVTGQ